MQLEKETDLESVPPNRVVPNKVLIGISKSLIRELSKLRSFLEIYSKNQEFNLGELLKNFEEFESRMNKVYSQVDAYFDEANKILKKPIKCSSSCTTCCSHYPSSVEAIELLFHYSKVRKRDDFFQILEACQERSDLFAKLTKEGNPYKDDLEDRGLKNYYKVQKTCAFLMDNKCSTYQFRPISCRMYFSTSDPEWCGPEFLPQKINESFIHYFDDDIELEFEKIANLLSGLELSDHLFLGLVEMNLYEGEFYQKNL